MRRRSLSFLALVFLLGGCATEPPKPHFMDSPSQTLAPPPPDKAQIVFLEPINAVQGLFPVGIFEINGTSRTLLATTGAHTKVALLFEPGHHVLMANHSGMIAHFLDANVAAGKRYYVLVRFIYGMGFQLRPIRPTGSSDYTAGSKDFAKWVNDTRLVDKTPDGDTFYEQNRERIDATQAKGWEKWLAKTPEERAELTLNPEDAVAQ